MPETSSAPMWAYLIHLSYNMWGDRPVPEMDLPYWEYRPYLRCDRATWDELIARMADAGVTAVVIDLGDGVRWESHPEIAVENAWSPADLASALSRIRGLGMEPIPKMNFSTCHDAWMGPYARMVSTPEYYRVCAELIGEAARLFDGPRLFHLGMDEENIENHRLFEYVVLRQYDLWWHDLQYLVDRVEESGSRAWVWSDMVWDHPDAFLQRMPRSVLQSNWYYGASFEAGQAPVDAYSLLDANGFDQVPTGSNWADNTNFAGTVEHACCVLDPARLKGFLQTVWAPTLPETRQRHIDAIDQLRAARAGQ